MPVGLEREKQTISSMLRIFCRDHHGRRPQLCNECQALSDYALGRLDHCPFGEAKTTCFQCPVHCYKPAMREEVKKVMRYAGPRMIYHHPWMALRHRWHGLWGRLIGKRPAKPTRLAHRSKSTQST